MKINWKVRLQNPIFIVQLLLAIIMPIMTYAELTFNQITSWTLLWTIIKNAAGNPYIVGVIIISIWNAITDPAAPSLSDKK